MAEYKAYLDALFEDADVLLWEITEKDGDFTNYAFIRKASQKHQKAYIQLLNIVADHRSEDEAYLFNIAHENIGARLSRIAQSLGYKQVKSSKRKDVNIFGDQTACVVYQRTEQVTPPQIR